MSDLQSGHTVDRIEKSRKKSQQPAGFEPTTSRVLLRVLVLQPCAPTTASLILKGKMFQAAGI